MPYASKCITASAAIKSGVGSLIAAVITAGVDAATVTLYDNTEGSGTVLCKLAVAANTTAPPVIFPDGIPFMTGCYAVITGTTPTVTVEYG